MLLRDHTHICRQRNNQQRAVRHKDFQHIAISITNCMLETLAVAQAIGFELAGSEIL